MEEQGRAPRAMVDGIVLLIKAAGSLARALPETYCFVKRQVHMIALQIYDLPLVPFLLYVIYPQGKRQRQRIERARRINAKLRKLGVGLGQDWLIRHDVDMYSSAEGFGSEKDLRIMAPAQQHDRAIMYGGQRRRATRRSISIPSLKEVDSCALVDANGRTADHGIRTGCVEDISLSDTIADGRENIYLHNVTTSRGGRKNLRR